MELDRSVDLVVRDLEPLGVSDRLVVERRELREEVRDDLAVPRELTDRIRFEVERRELRAERYTAN